MPKADLPSILLGQVSEALRCPEAELTTCPGGAFANRAVRSAWRSDVPWVQGTARLAGRYRTRGKKLKRKDAKALHKSEHDQLEPESQGLHMLPRRPIALQLLPVGSGGSEGALMLRFASIQDRPEPRDSNRSEAFKEPSAGSLRISGV